ncbi:hypothetical protein [Lacinutrix salivirga]
MKKRIKIYLLTVICITFFNCNNEDDSNEDPNVTGCSQQLIDSYLETVDDYAYELIITPVGNDVEFSYSYRTPTATCFLDDNNNVTIEAEILPLTMTEQTGDLNYNTIVKGIGFQGIFLDTDNVNVNVSFKLTLIGETTPIYEFDELLEAPYSTFIGNTF